MLCWKIRLTGVVQGVGMRPTIWRIARKQQLTGEVYNDGQGVGIVLRTHDEQQLQSFLTSVRQECPPLATLEQIIVETAADSPSSNTFDIQFSRDGNTQTGVAADAATCPDCLREIRDTQERRHNYAFTNCTHCGPRLSIITSVPYDRAHTSMVNFVLCHACEEEYKNPADRRFHAQPIACPDCGPTLWLEQYMNGLSEKLTANNPFLTAAHQLKNGGILAIKGIGGFHLACNGADANAVAELRRRKHRYAKPLALMASSISEVSRYVNVTEADKILLESPAAPVVLLPKAGEALPEELAPGQSHLGFMLPYTPLHHLLLDCVDFPLVMTSGNISGEPQCIDNDEARRQLGPLVDLLMLHDRPIINRLDDSVVRTTHGRQQTLRRARGYAPQPLYVSNSVISNAPRVLAMGAGLKNTFCLLNKQQAVVSQHNGDLESATAFKAYRHAVDLYLDLYDYSPDAIAVDRHSDYPSSQWGRELSQRLQVPIVEVQHHHAHIAATMVEHNIDSTRDVLGVALDGLGYGDNGQIWGGEFLRCNYRLSQRLFSFDAVPMPGGAMAMRQPWRNTYTHLRRLKDWQTRTTSLRNHPFFQFLHRQNLSIMDTMMSRGMNAPSASSAGRLFDAVAALLGICTDKIHYEGEAAMRLEALASDAWSETIQAYPFTLTENQVTWPLMWQSLLQDMIQKRPIEVMAARFHRTLIAVLDQVCTRLSKQQGIETIVLSGGVFQNQLLLSETEITLRKRKLQVFTAENFPLNDGGISLGQAAIAAHQLKEMTP